MCLTSYPKLISNSIHLYIPDLLICIYKYIHNHTKIYSCIYIYMCVCVFFDNDKWYIVYIPFPCVFPWVFPGHWHQRTGAWGGEPQILRAWPGSLPSEAHRLLVEIFVEIAFFRRKNDGKFMKILEVESNLKTREIMGEWKITVRCTKIYRVYFHCSRIETFKAREVLWS